MDHLSADLLCKNLPGDPEGIQVINIHIGLNNNRETNHTTDTQSCVYVSPMRCIWLNICQIKFLQVVRRTIYYVNKLNKLSCCKIKGKKQNKTKIGRFNCSKINTSMQLSTEVIIVQP